LPCAAALVSSYKADALSEPHSPAVVKLGGVSRSIQASRNLRCFMQLLPRKRILAIAAVIDIALQGRSGPVAAKALASRHRLPPRHLEPVRQALVRHGILKSVRGPRGGYELAREWSRITADEILRAAGTLDDIESKPIDQSKLLDQVVMPALSEAEQAFAAALSRINIEELARSAESVRKRR